MWKSFDIIVAILIVIILTIVIVFAIIGDTNNRNNTACSETCIPYQYTQHDGYCYCKEDKSTLRCVDTARHKECK